MRKYFPIVVLLLCTAFVAECVWFTHTQSFTYDEPVHIAAGLDAWRNSRFQMWNDHPPLARLWCALPLLNEKWEIHVYGLPNGFRADQISPDPEALAWRARAMNVVFGLALGLLLWNTARRMFSSGAAILALALFVSSPAAIAHFSLATTDGAATLFIFLTAVFLLRWRESPSLANTICFGVVLGGLLLSKFSTPVIFVMALLWMLILSRDGIVSKPWKWNWGKTLIALLLALMTVWAGYFFHVSRLTLHDHELITTFPNRTPVVYEGVKSNLNFSIPVPAGEYLEGLRSLMRHNRFGQIGFFLGRISRRGFKLYFPVTILLKWPVIMLGMFAMAAVLAKRKLVLLPSGWWVMMSFPLVYLAFAIFSRFDIGDRHVLPIYPFMLLLACSMWEYARTHRVLGRVVVIAVLLQAVDTLRYAPDYLSYFNVYVSPTRSYELLSDSNLDWGQGLLALRKYQRSHPDEQISLAYFGSVDPRIYGIQARMLPESERVSGTVVISASNLSGQFLQNPSGYHWVLQYPLKTVLNHSLYVFDVPAIRH
jgi:Dolichyl-phosphate-mannose-protein mannosyltransferase